MWTVSETASGEFKICFGDSYHGTNVLSTSSNFVTWNLIIDSDDSGSQSWQYSGGVLGDKSGLQLFGVYPKLTYSAPLFSSARWRVDGARSDTVYLFKKMDVYYY